MNKPVKAWCVKRIDANRLLTGWCHPIKENLLVEFANHPNHDKYTIVPVTITEDTEVSDERGN